MKDIDQILNDLNLDSGTESFEAGTEGVPWGPLKPFARMYGYMIGVGGGPAATITHRTFNRFFSKKAAKTIVDANSGNIKTMTSKEFYHYEKNFKELRDYINKTSKHLIPNYDNFDVRKAIYFVRGNLIQIKPERVHNIKGVKVMSSIIHPHAYSYLRNSKEKLQTVTEDINNMIKDSGNPLAGEVICVDLGILGGLALIGTPFKVEDSSTKPSVESIIDSVFEDNSYSEGFESFEAFSKNECDKEGLNYESIYMSNIGTESNALVSEEILTAIKEVYGEIGLESISKTLIKYEVAVEATNGGVVIFKKVDEDKTGFKEVLSGAEKSLGYKMHPSIKRFMMNSSGGSLVKKGLVIKGNETMVQRILSLKNKAGSFGRLNTPDTISEHPAIKKHFILALTPGGDMIVNKAETTEIYFYDNESGKKVKIADDIKGFLSKLQ